MTGIEQARQQDHARPRQTGGDVADGRELGGAGEHDHAHRDRFDRREPGLAGGQPVDEAEADRRDRDPGAVGEQLPSARPDVRGDRDVGAVQRWKVGRVESGAQAGT